MRTATRRQRWFGGAACAALGAFVVAAAFALAPQPVQQAKLTASDAAINDSLGISVALDGDTAVVGAYTKNSNRGAAYVFTRSGAVWTEQSAISASDAADGDFFGVSVAVSGDTAVVGAYTKNAYQGAAYVFRRTGTVWTQEASLASDEAAPDDDFGYSVAIAGETVVVSAFNRNMGDGAAYVFVRTGTTWTQQAKLAPDDAVPGRSFGISVALAADTAVVGAPETPGQRGAVYVFTRAGTIWTQSAKLVGADLADRDYMGRSVACTEDLVFAGAPYQSYARGAVYVFARSGSDWTQQAKLTSADGSSNDIFGYSIACASGVAVVGAYDKNNARGVAYVFRRAATAWSQTSELALPDAAASDYFGYSVALSGDTALAGSFGKDGSGAAYVFTGFAPSAQGYCLPAKVSAKANAKHPEKSVFTASGTFDTGSGVPDFSGAATFDAGGFHLDVSAFVAKKNTLTFSEGGVTLTITPAKSGSSRAAFSVKATGDLAGRVDRDGPLQFRFQNAVHDLKGTVVLTKGALGAHCVTAPDLCVRAAAATVKGGGKDAFTLTLGFATDGIAPALGERDMTIVFGDAYTSPVLLSGAAFVRKRNTYVFTAKGPGITKATVDYSKGTIAIVGSRLDLGAFGAGGNSVTLTVVRGAETKSIGLRMSRAGAKLTY